MRRRGVEKHPESKSKEHSSTFLPAHSADGGNFQLAPRGNVGQETGTGGKFLQSVPLMSVTASSPPEQRHGIVVKAARG